MQLNKTGYIKIPSGEYLIGFSSKDIVFLKNSHPGIEKSYLLNSFPGFTHEIKEDFLLSLNLVTCAEFREFVDDTGYETLAEREGWGWVLDNGWKKFEGVSWRSPFNNHELDNYYIEFRESLPVMQVSWLDAESYCEWLTRKKGFSFFLPSEFVREASLNISGDPALHVIYDKVSDNRLFLEKIVSIINCSGFHPSGLIWEWTSDWFYGYPGSRHNREFGETYKVLKGGSLFSDKYHKYKEYRFRRCPTARSPYYGFRTATFDVNF